MNTNLLQLGSFMLASGRETHYKIECEAFTRGDWDTIAYIIAKNFKFSSVEGVPTGGEYLAELLTLYGASHLDKLLIVDDVLTTGQSMEKQRAGREAEGVVVFARGPVPDWVVPIFTLEPWVDENGRQRK